MWEAKIFFVVHGFFQNIQEGDRNDSHPAEKTLAGLDHIIDMLNFSNQALDATQTIIQLLHANYTKEAIAALPIVSKTLFALFTDDNCCICLLTAAAHALSIIAETTLGKANVLAAEKQLNRSQCIALILESPFAVKTAHLKTFL
jgi:hypothetical protein